MAEKILEKIKQLWGKVVDWWTGFNNKQKTMVVLIGAGVIMAFVILYTALNNPNYTLLQQCETTTEASQITSVLEGNIKYKVSDDGLQIKVPKKDLATARLNLAASGIVTDSYSIDDALDGSFTTTASDKAKKYEYAKEKMLENDFLTYFSSIKSAKVDLFLPENDGTLLAKDEEPGAAIALEVDDSFTSENAAFLARAIATAIGCTTTDNIVIMNMKDATLLFSGENDTSFAGNASSQIGVKKEAETLVNNDVKKVLSGTGEFGDVKVSTNLIIDFSSTEITDHQYTPADGQDQGLLSEEKRYTSESSGSNGGTPGTDSNTETTYYYQDNSESSATIEEFYKKYVPNEYIEYQQIPPGKVNYSSSSLAVSSTNYIVVKEEEVKAQGLLAGITWDEYKAANSARKEVPVTTQMFELASNASGIPVDNISILAYEENFFVDKEGLNIDIYDIIQIGLILLILGLLALVIAKSMRGEKQAEEPEELSVEELLQSNPEPQLDDINVEETSETKKLIEKFVDDNPEAAANLLRNWLNEDWG